MKGAANARIGTRFLLKSHATTFAHCASASSVMPPVAGLDVARWWGVAVIAAFDFVTSGPYYGLNLGVIHYRLHYDDLKKAIAKAEAKVAQLSRGGGRSSRC